MRPSDLAFLIRRRASNAYRDLLLRQDKRDTGGLHIRCMFSCSNGIYLYDHGSVRKLVSGNYFGLTFTDTPGELIATRYVQDGMRDERSFIYRFHFDGAQLNNKREIRLSLNDHQQQPVRVHQLRWHQGYLWVANTRQNAVWKCSPQGSVLAQWSGTETFEYDPDDVRELTQRARSSSLYEHYNSISFNDDFIYVLAHNSAGEDKSRNSFLVRLDQDLVEIDRTLDIGKACHNIFFDGNDMYICDSASGTLLKNGGPLVKLDAFIRGIDRSGSIMITGGSSFESNGAARAHSNSRLFFVDYPNGRLLSSLTLGRVGDVHDLICVPDHQPGAP